MSAEDWSAAPESRMGHILTQWAGNDAVVSSPHRPAHLGQGRGESHDRAYLRVTACDCRPDRSKREDPASPDCRGRAPRLPVRPDPHARPRRRRRLVSSLPATDLAVTAAVADRVSLLPRVALSDADVRIAGTVQGSGDMPRAPVVSPEDSTRNVILSRNPNDAHQLMASTRVRCTLLEQEGELDHGSVGSTRLLGHLRGHPEPMDRKTPGHHIPLNLVECPLFIRHH